MIGSSFCLIFSSMAIDFSPSFFAVLKMSKTSFRLWSRDFDFIFQSFISGASLVKFEFENGDLVRRF